MYGDFNKCSCIVLMAHHRRKRLAGLLMKNDVKCSTFHCIIHQEALCLKSVKQSDAVKTLVLITNKIHGGNRTQLHCRFGEFLDEVEAQYGDLLLHANVRWLNAGKLIQIFFVLKKVIPVILKV